MSNRYSEAAKKRWASKSPEERQQWIENIRRGRWGKTYAPKSAAQGKAISRGMKRSWARRKAAASQAVSHPTSRGLLYTVKALLGFASAP